MSDKLTRHQIEIISETAIREYLKTQKKAKKEKQDNRLFNTRLIIYNYQELKAHCDTIPEKIVEFDVSVFDAEKLSLEVLMRERAKTYSMMKYIDLMWDTYTKHSKSRDVLYQRRHLILNKLYVYKKPMSAAELAETLHISIPAVYKDRNIAIKNFSVFLFGLSAIDFK